MINPAVKAIDRIYTDLPPELKELMKRYILPEEEHARVLEDIKEKSYYRKKPVDNPSFVIVVGQTGSGKSNLTSTLYKKYDGNIVIIDSDKYKSYRIDSEEILRDHLEEYAFLTAPDSYLHRDEMVVDAMKKRYNILMECAPSQKEGLFVDIPRLIDAGYNIKICLLGVSSLNSLLSIHERYEARMQLNDIAAKLTGIERHDDSYRALVNVIKDVQRIPGIDIGVFERGEKYPYIPKPVYFSSSNDRRFSCSLEALIYAQQRDEELTMHDFENRYQIVENQMNKRNAPKSQKEQLRKVWKRYERMRRLEIEY